MVAVREGKGSGLESGKGEGARTFSSPDPS